jgi:hypothetical protein
MYGYVGKIVKFKWGKREILKIMEYKVIRD